MEAILQAYEAALDRLEAELAAYGREENLWKVTGQINNSGGNLILHLVGNLNHFIGAQLGDTGYVRDRPAEFADKNVPRQELTTRIASTRAMLRDVLARFSNDDLNRIVEAPALDEPASLERWILHLLGHLHYHLGQLSYHRRIVEGDS